MQLKYSPPFRCPRCPLASTVAVLRTLARLRAAMTTGAGASTRREAAVSIVLARRAGWGAVTSDVWKRLEHSARPATWQADLHVGPFARIISARRKRQARLLEGDRYIERCPHDTFLPVNSTNGGDALSACTHRLPLL